MANAFTSSIIEILNYLNNQPHPDHDFKSTTEEISLKDTEVYKTLVDKIKTTSGFIFLVGPWGSGKSTLINQIINDQKDDFNFTKRSFFGTASETAAKLILFTFWERIFITMLAGAVLIICFNKLSPYLDSKTSVSLVIQIFATIGLLVLADAFRVLYLIAHLIAASFRLANHLLDPTVSISKKVLVIDDLDRSSLTRFQQFGFLSHLLFLNRTIVVPVGFNDEDDKNEILQFTKKLSPDVIEMPSKDAVTFQIIKSRYQDFPFSTPGIWMKNLSARHLLSICYEYHSKSENSPLRFKRLIMIRIKDEISKLITTDSKLATEISFDYRHSSIHLNPPYGAVLTPNELKIVQSFGLSFDAIPLRDLIHGIATDVERKRGNNWPTLIFEEFLDDTKSNAIIERMNKLT